MNDDFRSGAVRVFSTFPSFFIAFKNLKNYNIFTCNFIFTLWRGARRLFQFFFFSYKTNFQSKNTFFFKYIFKLCSTYIPTNQCGSQIKRKKIFLFNFGELIDLLVVSRRRSVSVFVRQPVHSKIVDRFTLEEGICFR